MSRLEHEARSSALGSPAALGPLVRMTARGLPGRRRTLGMVLLAASPVLVAAVLAFGGGLGNPNDLALEVYSQITLALVVPLVALVLGTAAIGTEIDDGTVVFLLVKPVRRRTVVLAKMLVAGGATAVLTVPGAAISTLLVAGPGALGLVVGAGVATLLASILYASVFVALSVFTGRALVIGLGYVLVWEGFLTSILSGTRVLSIREYGLAVVRALGADAAAIEKGAGVALPVAVALSAVVLVGAFLLGAWRLERFEVSEAG